MLGAAVLSCDWSALVGLCRWPSPYVASPPEPPRYRQMSPRAKPVMGPVQFHPAITPSVCRVYREGGRTGCTPLAERDCEGWGERPGRRPLRGR